MFRMKKKVERKKRYEKAVKRRLSREKKGTKVHNFEWMKEKVIIYILLYQKYNIAMAYNYINQNNCVCIYYIMVFYTFQTCQS